MGDAFGTGIELAALGLGALLVIKVATGIKDALPSQLPGNTQSTGGNPGGLCIAGIGPGCNSAAQAQAQQTNPGVLPAANCANAVAAGSVIGNQVFLPPKTSPPNALFDVIQNGYIDPATGQAVNTEQSYAVYVSLGGGLVPTTVQNSFLPVLTDGKYYLSPQCG